MANHSYTFIKFKHPYSNEIQYAVEFPDETTLKKYPPLIVPFSEYFETKMRKVTPSPYSSRYYHDGDVLGAFSWIYEIMTSFVKKVKDNNCYLTQNGTFVPKDGITILDKIVVNFNELYTFYNADHYQTSLEKAFDYIITKHKEEKENADIRFIQWNNGKHWYVKINNVDFVWNNEQKWNTRESAEWAISEWKKSLKPS